VEREQLTRPPRNTTGKFSRNECAALDESRFGGFKSQVSNYLFPRRYPNHLPATHQLTFTLARYFVTCAMLIFRFPGTSTFLAFAALL
jgi:hypothetical protein